MTCVYLVHLTHNTSVLLNSMDIWVLVGVKTRHTDAMKSYWNKARACALSACQTLTKHIHPTIMAILLPGATGHLEIACKACPAEVGNLRGEARGF